MRKLTLCALLIATASAVPADAQFMGGTSPMDLSMQSRALTSSVIGNLSVRNTARSSASRGTPRISVPRGGAYGPTAALSDARFPYQASEALRAEVMKAFIGRVRRSNPAAASAIVAEFQRPEIQRSYAQAIRPYGFSQNDAADIMTVYLVSGWEIVNGGDATVAQVRAVRRQVAGQMASNPALRSADTRARFAEELKILTAIIGGGAGSAKREGNSARYAAGMADYYRQTTGRDLRQMRLSNAGFD